MANVTRRWRRVMAIGCSHGDLAHPQAIKDALEFRRRFNPQVRFHLGDLVDTACFRSGAAGGKDEVRHPRDDMAAAMRLLDRYEPNRIAWGNHDSRLLELSTHPKAIVAQAAGSLWAQLENKARTLKAKTCLYQDIKHGWLYEGGTAWGHGYMYNMMAVRDHAEMLGCPVVMAHLHTPQIAEGRTVRDTPSFCVGALADDELLTYGRRRRQSLTHGHGIVFGEISDTEAHLWLIRAENGRPMRFPPGI